jgi:hypothetical protein
LKSQTLKSHGPFPPNGELVVQLTFAQPAAVVVDQTTRLP